MSELQPGNPAPDFSLPRDGGGMVSLSSLKGKPVVVYFYPRTTPAAARRKHLISLR